MLQGRNGAVSSWTTWADRAAFVVLAVDFVIVLLTFRDYGLGWDDYTHAQYGELLLTLYRSGFANQRVFEFVNLYFYGGGFDMAAALFAKITALDLFQARRLVGGLIGLVGLGVTWRMARDLGGPIAGLAALALLAACPLFDGHMYINPKDAPFATAMVILLYTIVRAIGEYPAPSRVTVALFGIGLGLAFGSRILAAVLGPCAIAALALIAFREIREDGAKRALTRLIQFCWSLLPALLIGYLIMGLLWPWAVLKPLNPLLASEYFANFFEKPWRELYEGRLISVPDMPASYLPHLFSLKLPEIMLLLGFAGTVGVLATFWRTLSSPIRAAQLLLVVLAAFLPVAIAIVARPALYNGLRHFVFVVPPFAVLGGLAGAAFLETARRYGKAAVGACIAIFAVGVALPISDMARLHPFQYTAFNWISGGVRMAHHNYMLDYWGLAFKQTGDALRAVVAEKRLRAPAGRRWIVEICGPQPPAEIALGPQFETTWDRKSADFAMMLGTYYCRDDIKAPILVEIRREGVLYGRVYDMRGQTMPNLLTVPPPQ